MIVNHFSMKVYYLGLKRIFRLAYKIVHCIARYAYNSLIFSKIDICNKTAKIPII